MAALLCLISVWLRVEQVHFPSVSCFFTFLVLGGFRHISTENLALGSLRSDDWQLGRPHSTPRFVCLAVKPCLFSSVTCGAVKGARKGRSS